MANRSNINFNSIKVQLEQKMDLTDSRYQQISIP